MKQKQSIIIHRMQIIQNNTHNTQNIHNEIKIIAYGEEHLSYILEKDYKMILNIKGSNRSLHLLNPSILIRVNLKTIIYT